MIFKQELSPHNGRYTPLLCFHLDVVYHYFTLFLFIFRKVSIVKKQTSQTVEKEFQAGRDLIEDEFAEENRVKVEVYAYYAKSIGKNILRKAWYSVTFYQL